MHVKSYFVLDFPDIIGNQGHASTVTLFQVDNTTCPFPKITRRVFAVLSNANDFNIEYGRNMLVEVFPTAVLHE